MRAQAVDAGIEYEVTGEGRPVILLHGFPDSGRLWRNQVPVLAAAGFRVIVPDLRGYGRSDKPGAVGSYSLPALAGDVMAVLSDAGAERAHLVGHDWGAALGWILASMVPDRVDHLAVLSVGHPSTFRRTLEQNEKSWYMLLFQFACCCGAVAQRQQLGQLPGLVRSPGHRGRHRRAGGHEFPDARPQLVPGQPARRVLGSASAGAAGRAGTDHGDMEQR